MGATTARKASQLPARLHVRVHVRDGAATVAAVYDGPTHTLPLPARTLTGPCPDPDWSAALARLGWVRQGPWVWCDDRRLWFTEISRTR